MSQKRVLVVDDDDEWRSRVRDIVEELSYKAIVAASAREAARLLDNIDEYGQFDLLITDNWMLGPDAGLELLIRNKLLGQEIPSILHTSYLSLEQKKRLKQEVPDVIGVLKSPDPDFPELKAAIEKLMPE